MKKNLCLTFIALCFLFGQALSLNPIVVKGNLLFDSVTKQQFWVKGVDYQPKDSKGMNYDVLADMATINRDLPYLKQLGINAIRVYEVDAEKNHDAAMAALEAAGIYVILDVPNPEPNYSIEQQKPVWNLDLYRHFTEKVDAFVKYTNLMAFIASNEVSNQVSNTNASAFVKAAIRDLKSYLKSIGKNIPVGYAIADDGSIVLAQQEYFACGTAEERPDFYGINIYRWCGDSNYELSSYNKLVEQFTNWPIPVVFSEYGCNNPSPRIFTEVAAIYGGNMTNVFSGGLVYEYSEEVNAFGLVNITTDGQTVIPKPDFDNLKTQLGAINPQGTTFDAYNPTPKTVSCPAVDASTWLASAVLPPAVSEEVCNCAFSKLECRSKAKTFEELDGSEVDIIYSSVCASNPTICDQISADASTGTYGQYSMCDSVVRVSIVMNDYYVAQGKAADACDWAGFGEVVAPTNDCTGITLTSRTGDATSTQGTGSNSATNTGASNSRTSTGTNTNAPATTNTEVIVDDDEGSAVTNGVSLAILAVSVLAVLCQ